jgi:hypothetical protein
MAYKRVAQEAALQRVGDNFHRTRMSHNVNVDPNDLAEVLKLAGYYDIRPPEKRKVTAAEVLSFLDFFAGQEDTAEDVRDFVQMAGRFVAEGKTRTDFRHEEEMFGGFISWLEEQEDELGFSDRADGPVERRETLCASDHCTDLPPHVQATGDCHYARVRP